MHLVSRNGISHSVSLVRWMKNFRLSLSYQTSTNSAGSPSLVLSADAQRWRDAQMFEGRRETEVGERLCPLSPLRYRSSLHRHNLRSNCHDWDLSSIYDRTMKNTTAEHAWPWWPPLTFSWCCSAPYRVESASSTLCCGTPTCIIRSEKRCVFFRLWKIEEDIIFILESNIQIINVPKGKDTAPQRITLVKLSTAS